MADTPVGQGDLAGVAGERVEWHRRRRGLSRRELGALVGHTERWVCLLETEGRGALRLDNLISIARALRLDDLSTLTGRRFTATSLDLPEHPAVPEVRQALTHALLQPPPEQPPCTLTALEQRIRHAWAAWHVSRTQNTSLGLLLPSLLRDATALTRTATGSRIRDTHAMATRVHLLGQRFAYSVRAMDLAVQFTDRALLSATAADSTPLTTLAGWASAMTSLTAHQPQEAEDTALITLRHLPHPATAEESSLRGALLLFAAMGAAADRRPDEAWTHWKAAEESAQSLGTYVHPETMFGQTNVAIYAVAVNIECGRTNAAVASAQQLDPRHMPSANRRAQHFIDLARSHHQAKDRPATRGALLESVAASRETIVFNPLGRQLAHDLVRNAPPDDTEVANLAQHLGLR
ncbi:helix-turn-helix domain-containing protein [Streptomyces albipurpureus]|uniref:Helix-turn-helix domain-containing protein n=1 Tax=Streptomyces albipurpureus TaxID=2897419 RepID=A0ABT0UXG9_9ACTN|nr:helix-turn-helix domain-containing protein [Streptomyces sp. CWNU-1]MCM2393165.1 helix-turn-helix domain-containing protein [Streptomyces sp. CWNU-1]